MAELNKVRIQVLDPATGTVVESVDVKTSDAAVYLSDGTLLRDWLKNTEEVHGEFQKALGEHLMIKHVDADKVDSVITGIEYDESTGIFTFTKHDGTTSTVDTLLEKLAVNFDLVDGTDADEGKKFLEITLDDGTTKRADLSSLIDVYTGSNGDQIVVSVSDTGEISATVVDKSIGKEQLTEELVKLIEQTYELPAATTTKLGGVIVGDGLSVDDTGKLSANNVKKDGTATGLNFETVDDTVVISVTGPEKALVMTPVGTAVADLEVTATTEGTAKDAATLEYQWFKKVVGTDAAFTAIVDGTNSSYAPAVDVAGTTIYYCRVSATGDGVVADPVASKQVTVTVA